ncbi:hypothetical protein [Mesonia sp. HuA40]|uniref:hypothetical protein n=1 Tax=Mesonia sp. HuA40 TaxID=2602761 RepID=UPI00164F10CF|nr:hypothetical protein [Mesonia sp. HuA40]
MIYIEVRNQKTSGRLCPQQMKEKVLVRAFWEDLFDFEALLSVSIAIKKPPNYLGVSCT